MDRRQRHVLAPSPRRALPLPLLLLALVFLSGAPRRADSREPAAAAAAFPSPAAAPSPGPTPAAPGATPTAQAAPSPTPTPAPHVSPAPTPASTPSAAPATVTGNVHPSPPPTLPGPVTPRARADFPARNGGGFGGNNPRPWAVWHWWKYENRQDREAAGRPRPPLAPVTAESKAAADAEDSAAVQRIIEQLPPEDRAGFLRNLKRWAQLTTEERQTLRRQAGDRRQRIEEEMQAALRESGLQLDEDHRAVFMLRYGQERRRLERELQEKIAAERTRRTTEIIERLKREFEPLTTPASTPLESAAPAVSPTVTAAPSLTSLPGR